MSRTTFIYVFLIVNILVETDILNAKNRTILLYKIVRLFSTVFFFCLVDDEDRKLLFVSEPNWRGAQKIVGIPHKRINNNNNNNNCVTPCVGIIVMNWTRNRRRFEKLGILAFKSNRHVAHRSRSPIVSPVPISDMPRRWNVFKTISEQQKK